MYGSSIGETLTSSSNDPTPLYTGERYLGSLFPNSLWSTQADRNLQLSYKMDQESLGKMKENTHFGSLATCALSTSYVCVTYCGSLTAVCVLPLGTGSLFRNCLTSILTRFQAHPLLCSSFAECQQLVYLEINQQNIHESENGPLTQQRF
jgi:hypothetical protein